jgi:hypothetical protein
MNDERYTGWHESQPIRLSPVVRAVLESRARSHAGRADDARIARVLLLLANGHSYRDFADRVDCSRPFISKWKQRFLAEGLAGLDARHEGRVAPLIYAQGGGAHPELDAQEADGRSHTGARAGWPGSWVPSHDDCAHLAEAWHPAPPNRAIHGVERSGVRRNGGRRSRALLEPATARAGALLR